MLYLLQMFGFSTVVVRKYFFGRCDPQGADDGEGSSRNFADAVLQLLLHVGDDIRRFAGIEPLKSGVFAEPG